MEKVNRAKSIIDHKSMTHTFVFCVPALDIDFWSSGIFDLFELNPKKANPGKELFFNHIHPDDRLAIELQLNQLMSGDDYRRVNHYRIVTPSGQQKHITAKVQREGFKNETGFLIHFEQSYNLLDQVGELTQDHVLESIRKNSLGQFFEGIGYWEYYPEYDHVVWSDQVYKLLNVPRTKSLSFEVYTESVYPEDLEKFNLVINSLSSDQRDFEFSTRHIVNNVVFWGLSRGTSVWENGKLLKLMGSFENVTGYREAQEKLSKVQRNAGVGWYEINLLDKQKSFASDEYLDMHEFKFKGRMPSINELLSHIHPSDHQAIVASRNKLYKDYESWDPFVYRMLKEDGSTRYFESSGEVILSPLDNQPFKVLAIVRDITDAKLKEQQLIQAHELAKLGWYESDTISGEQKISQQFLDIHQMTDYSEEAMRSKIHPEDVHELDKVSSEYRTYSDGYTFDYRIILESGDLRYIRNAGRYIHDPVSGDLAKVLGTVQDITEFKSLEERLQRAQRISQTGWFEFDILYPKSSSFSKEWLDMHDFEEPPLQLGTFLKKLHPVDRNLIPNLDQFLERMPTEWDNLEYRVVNRYGQKRYIYNSARVLMRNGKPVKVFGTTRDMTKTRMTEMALKESEQKYRLMSENSQDAILLLESREKEMVISFASDYAQKLSGYPKHELLGMDAVQLMHRDDRIHFTKEVLPKILFGQESAKLSFRLFKQDGTYVWVEASIGVLIEETPVKVQLSVRDISERKAYEEQLLRTNTDLNAMIKASDDIVFIVNKQLVFERVIVKSEESLHMPIDSFLENPIEDIWSDETGNVLCRLVCEVFETKEFASHEYQFELNGRKEWYGANINIFRGYDQKERVSVVIEKITRKKEAEQSLIKSMEMERELSKMRTNFVSMASHQFRTPLTVIKSNMQLLELADRKDPLITKVQSRLTKEVDRMVDLMEDILLLGKVQSGSLSTRFEDVDLQKLIENIKADVDLGQKDGRSLDVEIIGEKTIVKLDERLMRQAILNLVTNAFKYSADKPNPVAKLDFSSPEHVQLEIVDFGIGISSAEQDRVFKDFYRSEKVSHIAGTGLGLSISLEFLKLNNCELNLHSKLNEGSVFTIAIPKEK